MEAQEGVGQGVKGREGHGSGWGRRDAQAV